MRVLVTGASGLLGAHLAAAFSGRHEVVGVDRHPGWGDAPIRWIEADLTGQGFAARLVREEKPQIILHCAAMANVDACEKNPEAALRANAGMTRELAVSAPDGSLFVYISTDGLFRGDRPFVDESVPPAPKTIYGRTKLQGEAEVRQACPRHLVVRTNFYGWSSGRKKTAAEWLYQALKKEEAITLFDDFHFTPIYVVDFVRRLEALIRSGLSGTFHLAGKDRVSKSDFGFLMAELAGFPTRNVRRGHLAEAQLLTERPRDMSLGSSRFRQATGCDVPTCEQGLRRFLEDAGKPLGERFLNAVGSK
jgi:dTDP-4-dehydrorhamnose reductase